MTSLYAEPEYEGQDEDVPKQKWPPLYEPYPNFPGSLWRRPDFINLNWVTGNADIANYTDLTPDTVRGWFHELKKYGNKAMPLMESSIDVMKIMIEIAYPSSQIIPIIENYHKMIKDIEWDWDTKSTIPPLLPPIPLTMQKWLHEEDLFPAPNYTPIERTSSSEYDTDRMRDDFYAEFQSKVHTIDQHVRGQIIEIMDKNADGPVDVNPKLYDEMLTAEGPDDKWPEGKLTQKYLPEIEKYINYFKHLDEVFPWRVTRDKLNSGRWTSKNIYGEWKVYMKELNSIHGMWMFYKMALEPFSKPVAYMHTMKPTNATPSVFSFGKVASTKGGNKSRKSRKAKKNRKTKSKKNSKKNAKRKTKKSRR
jgi:hypothetical protein